ncbi:WD40/YVTN/BNR-like repeat-containing protein [Legionella rowbothamii]|uniref:WD40/YVTN/BNR-like repeat-containing protein n=1 Tax=Legionella rowbothamii TaxID=96229 RepID=UPI0010554FF7|nr:hypothetical protein [Legionella rowbothamii]
MNKVSVLSSASLGFSIILSSALAHAATPVWTFSAPNPALVLVDNGQTATVQYTVTNQSTKTKKLVLTATPGVSASPCYLVGKGSTCSLILTINGSLIPAAGLYSGPILCEEGNPNQCYQPSLSNQLQIKRGTSPILLTTISVNPASLTFVINTTGVVTVTNQSATVNLNDLQVTLPANLNINPSSTCVVGGTLAVNSSCTLDFSATAAITNENILIQGSNSNLVTIPINVEPLRRRVAVGIAGSNLVSYYSIDNGANWILSPNQPVSLVDANLLGISCGSTGLKCIAVGYNISSGSQPISYTTIDGGQSWSPQVSGQNPLGATSGAFDKIYCDNTANKCVATGTTILGGQTQGFANTTSDGGVTWALSDPIPGTPPFYLRDGLSCDATVTNCTAVGGGVIYNSSNSGVTWVPAGSTPPGGTLFYDISVNKSTGLDSIVVGYGIYAASYINNIWTPSSLPPIAGNLLGVSCTADLVNCISVGTSLVDVGVVLKSIDLGQNWLQKTLPSPNNKRLIDIFCDTSQQYCTAVGLNTVPVQGIGYYSLNGGEDWFISNVPIIGSSQILSVSGGDD